MPTGLTDFLSTTVTGNLNKLLQPTFVFIALIFLFLNVLCIGPLLQFQQLLYVNQILNADDITKTLVVIPLILVLAYIFLSLNKIALKIMTGEAWMFTWLGQKAICFQIKKRNQLKEVGETVDTSKPANMLGRVECLEYVTSYPEDDDQIEPTALGNVLNATSSYIWHHYGIDMIALWPHMNTVIGSDSTLFERVTDEKSILDFLVNLAFILIVFSIELLLTFIITHNFGLMVLWVLLPLALSYAVYQAAVMQARTWGDVVQEAFDLHRDDLKKGLGLRDFTSQDDERQVWQKVSAWLIWGKPTADDCFASQPTPSTPGVTCSANIKVDVQTILAAGPPLEVLEKIKKLVQPQPPNIETNQQIMYSLLVSNVDTSDKQGTLQAAFILISDPQIPKIYFEPSNINSLPPAVTVDSQIISSQNDPNNSDGLLWTIKGLQYNSAAVIRYSLPLIKKPEMKRGE